MEGGIGSRLKLWRQALGLTQAAFAKRIGVHIGVLKKYEQGLNVPGGEALAAIARTGVNMNWLLTGEGEMHASPPFANSAVETKCAHAQDELPLAKGPTAQLAAEEKRGWISVRDPARWQAIIQLVDAIDDASVRLTILDELFSRAQSAAEVNALRRAVLELRRQIAGRGDGA